MKPLALFLLLCTISSGFAIGVTENYPRNLQLKDNGDYVVFWKVSGFAQTDQITFEIHARTLGWIGFGLSPNGGMPGSDIVIGGWNDQTKQPYLYDRYAETFGKPMLDSHNDYNLIQADQNATHTMIKFSRKLSTCDDQDFAITNDTIRFIWAISAKDPQNPDDIQKHDNGNRGTRTVILLDTNEHQNVPTPSDAKRFEINVDKAQVPGDYHTLYLCKVFKMPNWGGKRHIVKFEPIIQPGNEPYVHHIVVYQCNNDMSQYENVQEPCFDRDGMNYHPMYSCTSKFLAVWAVGGSGSAYPSDMGYPIDMSLDKPSYILVEMHYDNSYYHQNIVDSSGMRFYVTDKLRPTEIGSITIAMGVSSTSLMIPPGQSNFKHFAFCSPRCTKHLPKEGITIYDGFLHEHLRGKAVRVRHFRGDTELEPIFEDNHYDFNYQQIRYATRQITILQQDTILVECEYDTSTAVEPTYGGFSTSNEMCAVFLDFFPRDDGLFNCAAGPMLETYLDAMGSSIVNLTTYPPKVYNPWDPATPLSYTDFVNRYFNDSSVDEKSATLQKAIYEGNYFESCIGSDWTTDPITQLKFHSIANVLRRKATDEMPKPLLLASQYENFQNISLPKPMIPFKKQDICLDASTAAQTTGNLFFSVVITLVSYLLKLTI